MLPLSWEEHTLSAERMMRKSNSIGEDAKKVVQVKMNALEMTGSGARKYQESTNGSSMIARKTGDRNILNQKKTLSNLRVNIDGIKSTRRMKIESTPERAVEIEKQPLRPLILLIGTIVSPMHYTNCWMSTQRSLQIFP